MSVEQLSKSLMPSLPPEVLMSPASLASALQQVRARRQSLELERVRRDADQIRARCQTFAGFFREAWHVLEPATQLRWSWHMDAISQHLQAVTDGKLTRLIINVPPGSSKSLEVSVAWQAYEWGPRDLQGNKFLSTSYELGNVTRDTRKTRDLVSSEWFQTLWPVLLVRSGETSFANDRTGTREGVPFSSLTAKRGDRLVIDDPHSLDGAESEVEREKAVRRFIEGGQNRLNDQVKSAIVIVMQRLHERDLTGELLARELGYEHLMIPMEFEPERRCVTSIGWKDPRTFDGELMDPARFPREIVERELKASDYSYAGQYQQRPQPREGGMMKVDKIELVDSLPDHAQLRVRGWDIAGSTRKTSPFTAGGQLALCDGIVYITDMKRARAEIDMAERLIVSTARDDGRSVLQDLPQDPGQSAKSQKFHLSGRLAGLNFQWSPETGSKEDRAIPFASMVNSGLVRMVKGDWNSALLDEMRNFPGSAYKDQVDALSRAFGPIARAMAQEEDTIGAPILVSAG
jgi:predicted phage terminase large subunit-like protein